MFPAEPIQFRGARGLPAAGDDAIAAREQLMDEFEANAAIGSSDEKTGHEEFPAGSGDELLPYLPVYSSLMTNDGCDAMRSTLPCVILRAAEVLKQIQQGERIA
jgi:hypothetical protein